MTPNFTPEPLDGPEPRIQIAAVGPAMMRVAADECDGVMLHGFCTRQYLDTVVLPRLQSRLQARGLDRADFEISGGGFIATGADDAAVDQMYEWIRQRVGFYGSTPSYWPVFEVHDLQDLGQKLNALSKQGEWDAMTRAVPDEVVDLFCARGRYDEIVPAIQARFGGAVDVVGMPADTPADLLEDIAALPTPLRHA